MVGRKIFSFDEKKDHKIRGERTSEGIKQAKINIDPEERLARKRKRHNDTVTRFYYRNKDKVLKRKRLRYLQNKGLDKDEIIGQLLNDRTDLTQTDFRKNVV